MNVTRISRPNVLVTPPSNVVQPSADHRYHLPSSEEKRQSIRFIEQWKAQITAMKLEITTVEKDLVKIHKKNEKKLQLDIDNLRSSYEAATKALEDHGQRSTQGVRYRLQELERRLSIEQQFISNIRKVPDELIVEILAWSLQDEIPTRHLALVCRRWRALILSTPGFWRNLKAFFVDAEASVRLAPVLQRRIELSQSALLDITLDVQTRPNASHLPDLFGALATTGVERWRSLVLRGGYPCDGFPTTLEGLFEGNFSALRTLHVHCSSHPDPSKDLLLPIHKLIVQSRPQLQQLVVPNQVPPVYHNSGAFQRITKITGDMIAITQLQPLANLQELVASLPGHHHGTAYMSQTLNLALFPPLPSQTHLPFVLERHQLSSFQLHQVEVLEVKHIKQSVINHLIDFPELRRLSIRDGELCSIVKISAPKLTKLHISRYSRLTKQKIKDGNTEANSILQDAAQQILVKPTTLLVDLSLNTTSISALFLHWPQLKHLTLVFGAEFLWKGVFASALTRKKNPLCPALVTLRLESRSSDFRDNIEQWKAIVMSLFATRKKMPLETVEWRLFYGPWYKMTSSG